MKLCIADVVTSNSSYENVLCNVKNNYVILRNVMISS